MTGFCEVTTTDHTGLRMYLSNNIILKNKTIYFTFPFNKQFQSKCPTSVRFYIKCLENKITNKNLESKVKALLEIVQQRRLTTNEDNALNKVDTQITSIMIGSEKKIHNHQKTPLSPELHIALRTVTLWKLTLN